MTRAGIDRSAAAIAALQAALAAEQAAAFGYGVVGAHLSGARQRAAQADWVAHQAAANKLDALIRAAGAHPHAAAVGYQLPFAVQSAQAARSLAVVLEDRVARAYLALVALADTRLRDLGGREVRAAALRGAFWRGTTVAFPGLPASSLHS